MQTSSITMTSSKSTIALAELAEKGTDVDSSSVRGPMCKPVLGPC